MDPSEVLRIVDAIHRDKNIDKEIVFEGIEAALISAAKKHYGEEEDIVVQIDRNDGTVSGMHNGEPLSPEEMSERIGAQTAKQVMIQKIREAERDTLYQEYDELRGQLVTGIIQRYEGGAATVALSNVEAILPRGEQIPGETHHTNERIRATVYEAKKAGSRVKVILSRTKPHLVQRLFEQEIPEIAEGVIEIRAIAREPGYRTKVAVSSSDQRVDCVGACVGVRGNRIKNIVDELSGERIDIVRYNEDMQQLIPNALQPAEVDEVILCQMLGRAIVLVREDQLSLAIGRRGQNVRLASKLCIWDIEIMTREELDEQIEQAMGGFSALEGVEDELAEKLIGEGYLSYSDLEVIEPDALMEMGGLTSEQVDKIVLQAEVKAAEAERAAAEQRRAQRQQAALEAAEAAQAEAAAAAGETEAVAGETEAAAGETEAATGETEAATGETEAVAGETEAAAGETEAAAGETEAAAGETEAAAGETEAAVGEAEEAAGETEAAVGEAEEAASETEAAAGEPQPDTQAADGDPAADDQPTPPTAAEELAASEESPPSTGENTSDAVAGASDEVKD